MLVYTLTGQKTLEPYALNSFFKSKRNCEHWSILCKMEICLM